jgi:uncharacterized oxidoreductase
MPGHAASANSMPLTEYIEETIGLIAADAEADEILVERVKPLRFAERDGQYAAVFGMLNPA